jgi:hypothetical protein
VKHKTHVIQDKSSEEQARRGHGCAVLSVRAWAWGKAGKWCARVQ